MMRRALVRAQLLFREGVLSVAAHTALARVTNLYWGPRNATELAAPRVRALYRQLRRGVRDVSPHPLATRCRLAELRTLFVEAQREPDEQIKNQFFAIGMRAVQRMRDGELPPFMHSLRELRANYTLPESGLRLPASLPMALPELPHAPRVSFVRSHVDNQSSDVWRLPAKHPHNVGVDVVLPIGNEAAVTGVLSRVDERVKAAERSVRVCHFACTLAELVGVPSGAPASPPATDASASGAPAAAASACAPARGTSRVLALLAQADSATVCVRDALRHALDVPNVTIFRGELALTVDEMRYQRLGLTGTHAFDYRRVPYMYRIDIDLKRLHAKPSAKGSRRVRAGLLRSTEVLPFVLATDKEEVISELGAHLRALGRRFTSGAAAESGAGVGAGDAAVFVHSAVHTPHFVGDAWMEQLAPLAEAQAVGMEMRDWVGLMTARALSDATDNARDAFVSKHRFFVSTAPLRSVVVRRRGLVPPSFVLECLRAASEAVRSGHVQWAAVKVRGHAFANISYWPLHHRCASTGENDLTCIFLPDGAYWLMLECDGASPIPS